jgi:hypothetical protein
LPTVSHQQALDRFCSGTILDRPSVAFGYYAQVAYTAHGVVCYWTPASFRSLIGARAALSPNVPSSVRCTRIKGARLDIF